MIGFLRGKVAHLLPEYCLLDVGGVGYRVFLAAATRGRLKIGEEAALFTHLSVREDALTLYGFYSQEEYQLFEQLISVSGIGPKVALGILSAITVDKLCAAIHGQQLAVLMKLPGIGKKTAQRVILELKDKIAAGLSEDNGVGLSDDMPVSSDDTISEASAALVSLGYTQAEIDSVLRRAEEGMDSSALIRFALSEFGKKK